MTARRPCPLAPGPLEDYAARFDEPPVHSSAAKRMASRRCVASADSTTTVTRAGSTRRPR
ncbi:hypothetical protein EKG83_26565 [Saccharothrix syringae]|uniref:Uncharacterized protein n=1 Tax=Saccharothrix syringae TaxID=103733 RepID=A0A5Q0H2L4_SACSY|nr:hypothetical protein EKG83_26565 [Saccharothrix syringae]